MWLIAGPEEVSNLRLNDVSWGGPSVAVFERVEELVRVGLGRDTSGVRCGKLKNIAEVLGSLLWQGLCEEPRLDSHEIGPGDFIAIGNRHRGA
jgi:hypothetical protein